MARRSEAFDVEVGLTCVNDWAIAHSSWQPERADGQSSTLQWPWQSPDAPITDRPRPITEAQDDTSEDILAQLPERFDDVPGECLTYPSEWINDDYFVLADSISIGERNFVENDFAAGSRDAIERDLALAGAEVLGDHGDLDTVSIIEGVRNAEMGFIQFSAIDLDVVVELSPLMARVADVERGDGTTLR